MALQFGTITFSDPVKLTQWRPDHGSGLYCVCVLNRTWKPVPYQPIFFGLAKNLAEQNLLSEQITLESWSAHASGPNKLLVTHAHLPEFSDDYLMLFERQLIAQYQPPCNHWETLPDMVASQPVARSAKKQGHLSAVPTRGQLEKVYA